MRRLLLAAAVFVVPACGGGGGGGGGGGSGPPDPSFHFAKGFDTTFVITRSVNAMAAAIDGSNDVYVGGTFSTYNDVQSSGIVRLNADGSVDPAFNVGTGFNGIVNAIAPATDGSGDIYVGGSFTSYNGSTRNRIVRLKADGTIEGGFAIGNGFNTTVHAIAVARDGTNDVYVGGDFTSYANPIATPVAATYLIRLNADGSADSFTPTLNSTVLALAACPVGGNASDDGDVYAGGVFTAKIARFNSNGTLDSANFTPPAVPNNDVYALALGPGESVYMGGQFFNYNALAYADYIVRLDIAGAVDGGFNITAGGCDQRVEAITVDGSGNVYLGGQFSSYNGVSSPSIVRASSAGVRDGTFDMGTGFAGALGGDLTVKAIALPTDGTNDVWAGGYFTIYDGTAVDHFVRLNSDASLDASTRLGSGLNDVVRAMVPAPDGSGDMYVGGSFGFYNGVVHNRLLRVNADGTADPGFVTGTGFNQGVLAMAAAPDATGDIYVGGAFNVYKATAVPNIIRLDSSGTRVMSFNPTSGPNLDVRTILPAADGTGDLFLGGLFTNYNGAGNPTVRIIRVNSSGGIVNLAPGTGFDGDVLALTHAPDGTGDAIVGGVFVDYNGTSSERIIRLNGDLTVDTAAAGTGFTNIVWSLATSGANVLVGGDFTQYNGDTVSRSLRMLTASLALVPSATFDSGTGFLMTGNPASVRSLVVTPLGRIYAAGVFESYQGTSSNGIVALTANGSIDAAFVVGTGFTRRVHALALGGDAAADLYAGGEFRSYKSFTVDFLTALDQDGSLD